MAEAFTEAHYTSASYSGLADAILAATAVAESESPSAQEMEDEIIALEAAEAALVFETVATPVADPVAGAVLADSTVALTCSTTDAVIYYTIDGTAPTEASTAYTAPIVIADALTIKAKAFLAPLTASAVLTSAYTITT